MLFRAVVLFVVRLTLILTVAACGSSGTSAARRDLTNADLALGSATKANRESGGFSETVRLRGVVDGGGSIYGRLVITNLATADQLARLRLSVAAAGQPTAQLKVRRKKGAWKTRGGVLDFTMPERGGTQARVEARVDKLTWTVENASVRIVLTLTPTVKPLDPAGGSADFGNGKYYRTTLLVPHGRFEAKVVTKATGETPASEKTVTGWAIAEKRTGNVAPYTMAQRFIDVRDIGKDGAFALSAFQRSSNFGGKTQGWMVCVKGGKVAVMAPQLALETEGAKSHAESGYSVPQLLRFHDTANPAVKGVVKAGKLVRVFDDLKGLSKIERTIAERFTKPWTFRYQANWAMRGGAAGKMSGSGFYSYNQLK